MCWPFAKYVACGNDFILLDNRSGAFPLSAPVIRGLCHRQKGIGADGVILLENALHAHAGMRIFNSDGTEAEMCGNGLLCLVHWLASMVSTPPSYQIQTVYRTLTVWKLEQGACIEMGAPVHMEWNLSLPYKKKYLQIDFLDTGVPHAVVFVDRVDDIPLLEVGAFIRNHSRWQPRGTNVTVAQRLSVQLLKIRTYERGVEGETLACGTGAAAAALAAAHRYGLSSPLTVQTRSGEELTVGFSRRDSDFSEATLTGWAKCSFQGEVDLRQFLCV